MRRLGWRRKIKEKFGKDPLRCERCGEEMELWEVWVPGRGVIYHLLEDAPIWRENETDSKVEGTAQLCLGFKFTHVLPFLVIMIVLRWVRICAPLPSSSASISMSQMSIAVHIRVISQRG